VHVDAAGNLRGVYPGSEKGAPRLLIGSHLDTVPNAGAFDGILGVVLGVSLVESLGGKRLPFAIEIVGFSEEEGVRFGVPFIGSRALVGRLGGDLLDRRDVNGVSVREAIEKFGLRVAELPHAVLAEDTLGYLEFHIEQGPALEHAKKPLAAVEAIAAQLRIELIFTGHANHAGTTPMHLRRDALAGAAEWITTVERFAAAENELVATVGQIEAKPGAANVIPGSVRLTLDVRSGSFEHCVESARQLMKNAQEIAARRGLSVSSTELLRQREVRMDPFLTGQLEKAMQAAGCEPYRRVSGAGHDAMILAEKVPAAMLFVRSPGGVSHDPAETVLTEDVAYAVECGLCLLEQLAQSPEFLKRMCRA
jgi:allantoate deiminase